MCVFCPVPCQVDSLGCTHLSDMSPVSWEKTKLSIVLARSMFDFLGTFGQPAGVTMHSRESVCTSGHLVGEGENGKTGKLTQKIDGKKQPKICEETDEPPSAFLDPWTGHSTLAGQKT